MKFKEWNEIAELVGITAIVVSLVFVGFELRQSTAIARSDAFSSFSSQFFDLTSSAALDERMSGLISQVNQGALPEDFKPEDQVSIRMYQGAAVRVWEGLFRSVQAGVLPEDALESAASGILINNKYFRSTWAATKQLYTSDFIAYFESLPWNE
ncbi:MAG: hypothetical protein OEU90_02735 [Gammaproteobacteria bacterium]|nr:hypothetical protein [Gammaproteobacteria bacterium]MDH3752094.1 hypothetical protein [Gammaproteobacteria bacterium]MDH3804369.1 hypothetical protein [Gammaproteobacteria bacterium]